MPQIILGRKPSTSRTLLELNEFESVGKQVQKLWREEVANPMKQSDIAVVLTAISFPTFFDVFNNPVKYQLSFNYAIISIHFQSR